MKRLLLMLGMSLALPLSVFSQNALTPFIVGAHVAPPNCADPVKNPPADVAAWCDCFATKAAYDCQTYLPKKDCTISLVMSRTKSYPGGYKAVCSSKYKIKGVTTEECDDDFSFIINSVQGGYNCSYHSV